MTPAGLWGWRGRGRPRAASDADDGLPVADRGRSATTAPRRATSRTTRAERADEVPEKAHAAAFDAYQKDSGKKVKANTKDHNDFQENINRYLQGTPDDVFMWFAGYRMQYFAEKGLLAEIGDVWQSLSGFSDALKEQSTHAGKQYFVDVRLADDVRLLLGGQPRQHRFQMGFCVFVLANFMRTLPQEILEAAIVDGAGVWTQFWRITLPLCRPALAALATLEFTWVYNDFLWALIFISNPDKLPITSSLNNLRGQFFTDYNLLAAGSVLVALPTVLVFLLLQRHFISGLTLGSTKGQGRGGETRKQQATPA